MSVLALGVSVPAPASAEDTGRLSLAGMLERAKAQNPELRAARERARAAAAMPAQARALDDPTVSYEAWNAPDSFRVDHADNNIFRLSQKFPFPGKRALAGEVAGREADRSNHEATGVELAVASSVKRAYYELWRAHARLGVLERERALVERLSRVVEQRYGTGDASQPDVLRMRVELTHVVNQVQTERLAVDRARTELAALVSETARDLIGSPEPPPPPRLPDSLPELVSAALERRPDIAAERAAIAREETAVRLAKRNYLPDFELSVGRFVNYRADDGFGAMASVTLPIFNGAKYGAGVDEASARLAATRSNERMAEDRTRKEVEQAWLTARTALLQYELFKGTHIPQIEQALRVTESGYETGTTSFLELVDTLRSLESIHLEHIAAQAEFEKAYAELEQAVGGELPRPAAASQPGGKRHG